MSHKSDKQNSEKQNPKSSIKEKLVTSEICNQHHFERLANEC